jgi:hypothetical protein
MRLFTGGRARVAVLVLASVALAGPRAAGGQPDCPQSCIPYAPQPCATLPVRDYSDAQLGSRAGYDLLAGHLIVGSLADIDESGGVGWVIARDRFRVTGLIGAQPATFEARLHVSGYLQLSGTGFRFGHVSAALRESTTNVSSYELSTPSGGPVDTTLALMLVHSPDDSFVLEYELLVQVGSHTFAHERGGMDAYLTFTALPPGGMIVSCQGYPAGPVLPTRQTSWGRVKRLYR